MENIVSDSFKTTTFKKSKLNRIKFEHVGRYTFFVSNFLFMIVGFGFLCVGLTIVSKAPQVSTTDKIHAFIGTCDTILGILGITAICKRNNLIILFLFALIMLIPLHIGFGIEALLKINDANFYKISIEKTFAMFHYKIQQDDIESAYEMGVIQNYFKCCGTNGYEDYAQDTPYLPRSCCYGYPKYCEITHEHVFKRGCQKVVIEFTYLKRKITGISLLLLLIPLVYLFYNTLRNKNESKRNLTVKNTAVNIKKQSF